MYPPTDTPIDPLGLPPAPAAPALPTPAQPKSMNPIAKSVLVALAAMAGPGRGTGILQGLSLADQQAQARAQQQNALAVQDYTRQHQAYQDEQRTYQQQQTQRAAMLKNVLDSFQMELGNTTSDAEAENLYQSAGQLLSAQGFRGFDAASLKRKYHTPSAQERAAKAVNKFLGDKAAQQTLENDPESLNNVMIDLGNGVMVPFASAREQAGLAPLKGKPKTAPASSQTPREGVMDGKSVFWTMGPDGQPQIVQGVSPTPPAPKAPHAGNPSQGGGFTPEGLELAGALHRLTGKLPGRDSRQNAAIINESARQQKSLGASPAATLQKQAALAADAASLRRMQTSADAAAAFEGKAIAQADIISTLSKKVSRSQYPIINDAIQSGRTEITGDSNATQLANAIETFTEEYAKVMGGTTGSVAGATDSSRAAAKRLINTGMSHGTMSDVLKLMVREMDLTMQGYGATINHINERISGGGSERATIIGTDPRLVIRDFGAGVDDAVSPVGQSESDQRRKEIEAKIANLNQQRQGQK